MYVCVSYIFIYMDTIHIIRIIHEWTRIYLHLFVLCVHSYVCMCVCAYRRICRCMNCNTTYVHTYIHTFICTFKFVYFVNRIKINIIAQSTQGSTAIDTSLIPCIARRSAPTDPAIWTTSTVVTTIQTKNNKKNKTSSFNRALSNYIKSRAS